MKTQALILLSVCATLILAEPALANKFETIGSGVAGSWRFKSEFVRTALLVGGSIFAFAAVLAVVVPHTNAAFLNYANWKASAVVLAILSALLFGGYFLF